MQNFAEKFVQFDILLYFCRLNRVRMPAPPASTHKINNDWQLLNFMFDMKHLLKSVFVLFLVLVGVNTMSGQGLGALIGGINMEDPTTWFYVRLNASVSNPGCGTTTPGKVYLIYTNSDDERTPQNPWIVSNPKPENPYAEYGTDDWRYRQWSEEYGFTEGVNDAKNGLEKSYRDYWESWTDNYAVKEGYDAGYDWYKSGHYLNTSNPTGVWNNSSAWEASASLNGFAYLYAPGFDDLMGYSAYAYFFGKAAENDGWYFTGWSFTEGESDLGGVVGTADSLQFRILPSSESGEANFRNEYVYATFQPIMVSNYKVNGLINTSVSNSTTVVFDAVGQRVSTADFTVSVPEANFSATLTSCVDNKVTVTVTYSGSSDGEYRGNVTLASKSGCSQLTAPVYARVGGNGDIEATLYDGKTPTATTGSLVDMIDAANNTDKIVVLNKNVETATTINAKVTVNFNGYNIKNTLIVSGGELTVAYSKYGGGANALSVTGGKVILNGGEFDALTVGASGSVEQNAATFSGASTNGGVLITTEGRFEAGLSSNGTLTIDGGLFEGATAITVSGGTATINKATISGDTYGIQAAGGITNITSKLVSVYGATNAVKQSGSGKVSLTNGKFASGAAPLAGTINLQAGYFKVDGEHLGIDLPEGKKVLNVLAGTEFAEGYRYFVGEDASSAGVCRIGTTLYSTLEDALAYANNTGATATIIMTNDYTLPAGYYTLPANATLIIPMSNEQETGYPIVNRISNNSASPTDYVQPTEFRRLTFADGVNLDVYGLIEITCTQRASDDAYATLPHGPYGLLVMDEGSHMTLQSGSELRAWGYMIGKGETDARRGATVREQFQMGDWKGGSVAFSMLEAEDTRVFPITQYYIQNIESPVKYHPGAVLSTTTSVSANYGSIGMTAMANDIAIVGVSGVHTAMFLMDQEADAENTWVRKWYDAERDVQTYEVNSGAHLGSMVLDLGKLGTQPLVMNSGYFVLPITNNMKIHLLSGMMDFTQTTSLLPGAEVEVDKESVIKIVENTDPTVFSGSLYVYDADDWGKANGKGDVGTLYTKVVPYSPSCGGKPNVRTETAKPADAKINVHGSFDTGEGYIYTTPGGANIFSTNEDAGSFIFTKSAPASTSDVYQYINGSGYTSVAATSAKLKNGNEEYVSTETADNNQIYMYMDNEWKTSTGYEAHMVYFDCYTAETNMLEYAASLQDEEKQALIAIYHAPDNIAEYLVGSQVASQLPEANGEVPTPQAYEYLKVQPQYASLFTDVKANQIDPYVANVKATGYNLGDVVKKIYIKPQEWVEIVGTPHIILDVDDDMIEEFETLYATDPNSAVNGYMAYLVEQAYHPLLESVEGNSDHTFSDAAGAGRLFISLGSSSNCQWWEVEKKDNLYHCIHPENDTYYYWDETEEEWKEKAFTITWKNWDGTPVYTADGDGNPTDEYIVTYGTMAEFLGTNPTREADIDYTYDFTGWSPELAPVTSDVTYTATYEQKERKYTITFLQEGGVEIERHFLTHNAVPVCENVPTRIGHTLVWSPAIAAVTGDATYTATWEEDPPTEYEVTFFDYDGTTVLQQNDVAVGAMPEYSGEAPSGKPSTSEYTYVFDHWSPDIEEVSATSIKSYTAVYREEAIKYEINFYQADGVTPIGDTQLLPYGAMPVAPLASEVIVPTTEGYTYTYVWQNMADASKTIETVKDDADYLPVFSGEKIKYIVTLKSNPSEACTFTGAGIYEYGDAITISQNAKENYSFTNWTDEDGNEVATLPTLVTADITLIANFTFEGAGHTITWLNYNGSPLATVNQKDGTATIYTGATPVKPADAHYTYTFDGWNAGSTSGTYYKNNMTPKATADATYYAHFAATAIPDLNVTGVTKLTKPVTYQNLVITSNGISSGQLINPKFLTITGDAHFDLTLNAQAETWYAFGLPWAVNTNGGMKADGNNLSVGNNCFILEYDGSARASQTLNSETNSYWKYVSAGATLEAGKLYMIYLRYAATTLRFTKTASAPIINNSITLIATSGSDSDKGWNGVANSTLSYATFTSGWGLKYVSGVPTASGTNTDRYDPFNLATEELIVGQPFFVQANTDKTLVANGDNVFSAPRRETNRMSQYEVRIAPKNADYTDRIYVIASEEKEDQYIIGQDLGKISVANGIPQMWINRYDTKLSVNTQAMINNQATFPLGINIPADGAYTIRTVTDPVEDEELFITINGAPVWNLTTGQYTFNLAAGNTNEYGLLVVYHPTPEISTGCDQLEATDKPSVRKVLINGQVYILRDGAVYTIFGQKVK